MSSSNNEIPPTPMAIAIVQFHGMTLTIVEHEGSKYVAAKDVVSAIGLNWRTSRKRFSSPDSVILYGIKQLKRPEIAGEGGPRASLDYMRLDTVRGYLMRINLSQLRANGAVEKAEMLLNLQLEWQRAIHEYEEGNLVSASHLQGYKILESQQRLVNRERDPVRKASFIKDLEAHMASMDMVVEKVRVKRPKHPPRPSDPEYDRWSSDIEGPDEMGQYHWNSIEPDDD